MLLQEATRASTMPVSPGSALNHMSEQFKSLEKIVKGLEEAGGKFATAASKRESTTIKTEVKIDGRKIAEATHEHLSKIGPI